MSVLVTGSAGFIGFHVTQALLSKGEQVVGVDNLNAYYDPQLKQARLDQLQKIKGFSFYQADISDRQGMEKIWKKYNFKKVIHLAAQAGVRHSLKDPYTYINSNIMGHLVVMELARFTDGFEHLVYASSSSVYGGNTHLPFSVDDRVDTPVSLYAATKKADELMSQCYSQLYKIPQTGLRFFTVYGPWGRPDMSAYIFTDKILKGLPIEVFNHGDMKRDFTFIDDIVSGVLSALKKPPSSDAPHRVFNLGNHKSEDLMRFISVIEKATGKKAIIELKPMQMGDVKETYADIKSSQEILGFEPKVKIDEGIPKFVDWFKKYHQA